MSLNNNIQEITISEEDKNNAEKQILDQRKIVDYDTAEFTIEVLLNKYSKKEIFVPEYQRKYVWTSHRASKFIESIILGIPIPFFFFADQQEGDLEIVDGFQRIETLSKFYNNKFRLIKLPKISLCNNFSFQDLPTAQQKKFLNRSIRAIILSDRANEAVRFDIFERINTGSDTLKDMEVRRGAYPGKLTNLIYELSKMNLYAKICPLFPSKIKRREREELILRFFTYSDKYLNFRHDVKGFLNEYLKEKNKLIEPIELKEKKQEFINVLEFADKYYPYGFGKKNISDTPRVRFEALAIGTNLALKENPKLEPSNFNWLDNDEFKILTTSDASNSLKRLKGRIEFVRDKLLESDSNKNYE